MKSFVVFAEPVPFLAIYFVVFFFIFLLLMSTTFGYRFAQKKQHATALVARCLQAEGRAEPCVFFFF